MSEHSIQLSINGRKHEAKIESRLTLCDFLRGDAGCTGVHVGCEHGVCGACTVIVDGAAVRSCLMLAVQTDGCSNIQHSVLFLLFGPAALLDLMNEVARIVKVAASPVG